VLGLSATFDTDENPLPPTLCSCSNPDVTLRVINLKSKEKTSFRPESGRLRMELTKIRSPKKLTAGANRVLSAIGGLLSHAILSLVEILLQLPIAFRHLLLAKLITILFLLEKKQQIGLPVALQTLRNLLLTRLHSRIPKLS
jgi:hypothetical protein